MPENKSEWNTITQCRRCAALNPEPLIMAGSPGNWQKYHRHDMEVIANCGPIEEFQMIPAGNWDTMIDTSREARELAGRAHSNAETAIANLDAAYAERNQLVAALARHYRPAYCYLPPGENDWPIVYIETPAGQLSWHIPPVEAVLLGIADLPTTPEGYKWDGHSTEEKYERLAKLDAPTWIAQ